MKRYLTCIFIFILAVQGLVIAQQNDDEQMLNALNKLIEENPKDISSYTNRGLLYLSRGKYENAIDDFNEIIKLNPKGTDGYLYRGLVFISMSEYEDALSDFDYLLKINDKSKEGYIGRALSYYGMGKYDEAITDNEAAIKIGPGDQLGYVNLSKALIAGGYSSRAIDSIDEMYGKFSDSSDDLYQDMSSLKILRDSFRRLNRFPDIESLEDIANRAYDKKDYEKAREYYSAILILDPTDEITVYDMAMCLWDSGDKAGALFYLMRYLYLNPDAEDEKEILGYIDELSR